MRRRHRAQTENGKVSSGCPSPHSSNEASTPPCGQAQGALSSDASAVASAEARASWL